MSYESEAWNQFLQYVEEARAGLDGCVPVALVCLPVEGWDPDGAVRVEHHARFRIVWPATFPVEERGPLLERMGGGVSRRRG